MGNQNWIYAPHRIIDNEQVVYGTGDQVPMADAVKYGLVDASEVEAGPKDPTPRSAPDPKTKTRGRRKEPEPTGAKPGRKTRAKSKPDESR